MKACKLLILLFSLLFILGCSNQKGFNFKNDWTWEELSQFSEDSDTQKYISYLEKKMTIDEAYFIFRELKKIKNPQDIYQLAELEKYQRENGGQFYSVIPDFFKKKEVIPPPDTFEHIIADVFYFTQIRDIVNKNLFTAGIMYNLKFHDEEMTKINRKGSNLDLEISTETVQRILNIYDKSKVNKKEVLEIVDDKVFENMLICRTNDSKFKKPNAQH